MAPKDPIFYLLVEWKWGKMIINKKIANVQYFLLNPILKYINEKVENILK